MRDRSYLNGMLGDFYEFFQSNDLDKIGFFSMANVNQLMFWIQAKQLINPVDILSLSREEFCEHFKWEDSKMSISMLK